MKTTSGVFLLGLLSASLVACAGSPSPTSSVSSQVSATLTAVSAGRPVPTSPSGTARAPSGSPATQAPPTATRTPPPPTRTPTPAAPELRALPEARLVTSRALLQRPDGLAVSAQMSTGDGVVILARDERLPWYRVRWQDQMGWVPQTATNYADASKIPVLRSPPPCAKYLGQVVGLSSEWQATSAGRIVVVIDLYRSKPGTDFRAGAFRIQVNGIEKPETERIIESTKRQYLIQGAPIPVPGNARIGDRIGFKFSGGSNEALTLLAAIYLTDSNCKFEG